ncbi:hypothetical protein QJS10_CPB18g01254 [Acorus calamus]|uniref:Uncharacterized protein n=1 Tax=Acorus calamus TaxID=4465 RepID=A0AAV9CNG2_ACOCL|nr:hypothetical protein QJS10_CPB18g01254 [Acorus calamus]
MIQNGNAYASVPPVLPQIEEDNGVREMVIRAGKKRKQRKVKEDEDQGDKGERENKINVFLLRVGRQPKLVRKARVRD